MKFKKLLSISTILAKYILPNSSELDVYFYIVKNIRTIMKFKKIHYYYLFIIDNEE